MTRQESNRRRGVFRGLLRKITRREHRDRLRSEAMTRHSAGKQIGRTNQHGGTR